MKVPEYANANGLAETTVRQWLKKGLIPGYKLGKQWQILVVEPQGLIPQPLEVDPRDMAVAVAGYCERRKYAAYCGAKLRSGGQVMYPDYLEHHGPYEQAIIKAIRDRDSDIFRLEEQCNQAISAGSTSEACELAERIAQALDRWVRL